MDPKEILIDVKNLGFTMFEKILKSPMKKTVYSWIWKSEVSMNLKHCLMIVKPNFPCSLTHIFLEKWQFNTTVFQKNVIGTHYLGPFLWNYVTMLHKKKFSGHRLHLT